MADLPSDFPALNTLDHHPHNIPAQPTPLIGRKWEVGNVCALPRHADVRLVTITGPGGVGKTRLALQVAAELFDQFVDGVYFVALAPIGDPQLVAPTISQTPELRQSKGQALLEQLKEHLRPKHLLLVLDNFEHLTASAPLIAELLATARQLKIVVTSRAILRLSGKHEFVIPRSHSLPVHNRCLLSACTTMSRSACLSSVLRQSNPTSPSRLRMPHRSSRSVSAWMGYHRRSNWQLSGFDWATTRSHR